MTKIIANVLATIFVIAVIGVIGVGALYVYGWSKAMEQDVTAQTRIKQVILSFNANDLSEFKKHLHPKLTKSLETKEGIQLVSFLGKIGELKAIDEVKWVSSKSAVSTAKGQYEVSNYEVRATFENGRGLVKVSTVPNGDGYYVTNFQIFSDYYATLQ